MNHRFIPGSAAFVLACGLALWAGCSSHPSGPGLYHVTGTITFDGEPIEEGEIIFAPDSKAGNQGPACIAYIQNGKYETQPGKGLVGGAYRIEIEGFRTEAKTDVDGEPIVAPLFRTYVTQHEFPPSDTTFDHDVTIKKRKRR